jgi:hypothetical protein
VPVLNGQALGRRNEPEMHNMKKNWLSLWFILLGAFVAGIGSARDPYAQSNADWTEPFPPFKIAGNLYYVGSKGLANYLIATPQGHILINSDLEKNVSLIHLKSLPCDIFLGAHGNYFDLETKYARMKESARTAFVDPEGYKKYVAEKEQAFRNELAKQRAVLTK